MKIILFISVLFLLAGAWFFQNWEDPYMSQEEKLVNAILGRTAELIKGKYDLIPSGAGSGMPGGRVQRFMLSFNTKKCLTRDELRRLLLSCSRELLKQINNESALRSALITYPFTLEHVAILIYNHDSQGNPSFFPDISSCRVDGDGLSYVSVDPDDVYRYKQKVYESYGEANEALKH